MIIVIIGTHFKYHSYKLVYKKMLNRIIGTLAKFKERLFIIELVLLQLSVQL